MALVNLNGAGIWMPHLFGGWGATSLRTASDALLLDADEEEAQMIGTVHIPGGGSKTFGTSGSKIDWLPGASITFAANSTLTVGVKKASSIDTANGPVARATIGAAAFDVSKALVGGTDTITSTTWRSDAMASGSGFSVADGDLLAICFHLDTTAGSPSVKVRCASNATALGFPVCCLVTSGPTYTAQTLLPNAILTFDDSSIGWLEPSAIFSSVETASGAIGNTNINGNVFRVPYSCKVDALAAYVNPSTNAANFALELYSTPLGTPSLVESISVDANAVQAINVNRLYVRKLTTPRQLTINTDYAIGVCGKSATSTTVQQYDVDNAAFLAPNGLGSECYAAISTAAGTFSAQNSGKRRYLVWARVSALDDGAGASGGGLKLAGVGGLAG